MKSKSWLRRKMTKNLPSVNSLLTNFGCSVLSFLFWVPNFFPVRVDLFPGGSPNNCGRVVSLERVSVLSTFLLSPHQICMFSGILERVVSLL